MLDGHGKRENVIPANSQIDLCDIPKTAQDQSGTRNQDQGQRELRNHQYAPQTVVPGARRRRSSAFL